MADPRLLRTEDVEIARIAVGARLRPASPAAVDAIAASMVAAGAMIQPVALREKDGALILMGGLHRLRACERLGQTTVRAEVWDCQDQFARLFEVHENLAGAELSTLELAQFLHEAKAAYEDMNPQTKAHVANNLARWQGLTDTVSFSSAIAEKRNISERHIRRLTRIGANLDRAAADDLRRVGRQPTHRELAQIAGLNPPEQRAAAALWAGGEAKNGNMAALMAQGHPGPAVKPNEDKAETDLKALAALWSRSSKAGRNRFLNWLRDMGHIA